MKTDNYSLCEVEIMEIIGSNIVGSDCSFQEFESQMSFDDLEG